MKVKNLEKTLKALANKRRLAIIEYLSRKREANVSNIAEHINLSFKSTSRHLSVLAAADILDKEQRSLKMFYSLSSNAPEIVSYILKNV